MPGSVVPVRVRWAVDLLDPRPDERLLEVGGGPGVCAALVCERLTTGVLVETDRSATAIARTRERCAEHLASGRLELRQQALTDLDLPAASVDTAFTIDVNLFWMSSAEVELRVLRRALVPGGRLAVLYGAGSPQGTSTRSRILDPVAGALRRNGFEQVEVVEQERGCGVLGTTPREGAPRRRPGGSAPAADLDRPRVNVHVSTPTTPS